MTKTYTSKYEDSGSGTIIPMGSSDAGSSNRIFPHLLDAISQIQQFYIIESKGKEIPDDFLTIRGKLNFFNVGFGAGFFEALIFAFLMCLTLPMISDQNIRAWIAGYFPPLEYDVFIWLINLIPVLISGGLCCYMGRYHIGKITKRAVDMLLFGRFCSLCVKGLLLFFVLMFISNHITPESAWNFSKYAMLKKYHLAVRLYDIILYLKPLLVKRAFETLAIFGVAMIMPFLTIWGVDWYRKFIELKNREIMER